MTDTSLETLDYTKCKHCELFVEENYNPDNVPGLAAWVHLHRDTAYDRSLDEAHEAEPGDTHPLAWWRNNGPALMRTRFTE